MSRMSRMALVAWAVHGCNAPSGHDTASGNDTDASATIEPGCSGSATWSGASVDPCVRADVSLLGVKPDGSAADLSFTMGDDRCGWTLVVDDLCGDGDVWLGGGGAVRLESTCGEAASAAQGKASFSRSSLRFEEGAWTWAGQIDLKLQMGERTLEGTAQLSLPVPDVIQDADLTTCSNVPCAAAPSSEETPSAMDVVFVVSDYVSTNPESSMSEEIDHLVQEMPGFVSALDARGVDYHLGVARADMSDLATAGQLESRDGVQFVTPQTPDRGAFAASLASVTMNPVWAKPSCLEGALLTIRPDRQTLNPGFFRDGVTTHVVAVSNYDDQAPANLSIQSIFSLWLKTRDGAAGPATFSAFSGPLPYGCHDNAREGQPGTTYAAQVQAHGGRYQSICDADWSGLGTWLASTIADPRLVPWTPPEPLVVESIAIVAQEVAGARSLQRDQDWFWRDDHVEIVREAFEAGATLNVRYAPSR